MSQDSKGSQRRRRVPTRIVLLVGVMAAVSLGSVTVAGKILYESAIQSARRQLETQVHAYDHIVTAAILSRSDGVLPDLLRHIQADAPESYNTAEVTIARRDRQRAIVIFQHGHRDEPFPETMELQGAAKLPIALALAGGRGTTIAKDYRGREVLAAYAPLSGTDWGLVAKIDLAEVRAPFVRAALVAGSISLVLVLIGAFIFTRINYPLVAELARSERRYRSLVEATPQIVWSADTQGRAHSPNPDWEKFTGQPPSQMAGQGWSDVVHLEDRERVLSTWKRAVAKVEPYDVEVRMRRHDGVYRLMHTRGAPVLDDRGQVAEWVGVAIDVTDERAAAEERARLTTAVEQASESVMITDVNGRIQYVNPAFTLVTGYSVQEAIGKTPRILNSGQHSKDFFRNLWHTILSGQTWRAEVTNRRKDGGIFTEYTVITPVRNDSGEIVNFIATRQDVTERHVMEDRLRQAQKMEAVGRLAGGVAHDFNNILNVILGYTELVTDGTQLDVKSRERLSEVLKAANRAAGLTRQLLAFSRKQVLQPCVLNLNSLLTDLNGMLRRIIGEDVELNYNLAPELGNAFADPGQVEQVVMNLVVNSRDAMASGGTLTIRTADVELHEPLATRHHHIPIGRYILLEISDTGAGISQEAQSHVFEPFFTTKQFGTGLGLAMVYGIVKQSGGHIVLKSEAGEGATFTIYLPRVEKPVEQLLPDPIRTDNLVGPETILLAEDAAPLRRMIREVLEPAGYTILTAENGSDAVEVAARHTGTIDLLLTDVVMPIMGGRELAKRLRQARPGVKVLYVSGYTDDQAFSLSKGEAFLQKPFAPAALLRQVRELLDAPSQQTPERQAVSA